MIRLEDMRLVPMGESGSGRVGRFLGSILLVSVEADAIGATALLELCSDHAESNAPANALVQRVTSLLVRSPGGSIPPFCLLVQIDASVRAIVNGTAQLTVGDVAGQPKIVNGEATSWTTVDIAAGAFVSGALAPAALTAVDPLVDLRRGVSRGAGFVLIGRGGSAPVESHDETQNISAIKVSHSSTAPPVVPDPAPVPKVELIDLRQPSSLVPPPPRQPLPSVSESATHEEHSRVLGLNCARGHFNDPRARYCAVCGIQMGQTSFVLVEGDRPPLGVLVLDNGESHPLVTDLIVGRQPGSDTAIQLGRARSVVPGGDASGLSRVHAELRLVEWEVQLIDRQSTNGTYVWSVELNSWQRLVANTPVVLVPGTQIAFGQRTAVYESSLRTG